MSGFGDAALCLTVGIWVADLTGDSSAAATVFFAYATGSFVSVFSAVWVDRVRRRPLLVGLNLITAVLVLLLLAVHDRHQLWLVYTVMTGYGLSSGTMHAAGTALLQLVVPSELLADVAGVVQSTAQIMFLAAPVLATGLLHSAGPIPVIVADAASFAMAALATRSLRISEAKPSTAQERFLTAALAGARHLWTITLLRRLTLTCIVAVAAIGVQETTTFAVARAGLHRSAAFIAVLATAEAGGAATGGVCAAWLMRRFGDSTARCTGLVAAACGFSLQATGNLPLTLAGCVLCGAGLSVTSVSSMSLVPAHTPPQVMGRTNAALTLALALPQTLFTAVGAQLQAVVDFRIILVGLMGALGAAALRLGPRASASAPSLANVGTGRRWLSGSGPRR